MATQLPAKTRDHLHYVLQGFNLESDMQGNNHRSHVVEVHCMAESHTAAIEKAKEIMLRTQYVIVRIEECATPYDNHDNSLDREIMRALQLQQLNEKRGIK